MASKTYHMDCHGQLRIRRADAPCLPGEPASHEWSKRMRRIFFAACALAAASPSSAAADSPYEEAAKREMEHMASSVLAASVCKGVRFNGAAVIPHLAAAALLLGEKRAEDAFFSAMRAGVDAMSANGREIWCSATIKAAKDRDSDMLTEELK